MNEAAKGYTPSELTPYKEYRCWSTVTNRDKLAPTRFCWKPAAKYLVHRDLPNFRFNCFMFLCDYHRNHVEKQGYKCIRDEQK